MPRYRVILAARTEPYRPSHGHVYINSSIVRDLRGAEIMLINVLMACMPIMLGAVVYLLCQIAHDIRIVMVCVALAAEALSKEPAVESERAGGRNE